MPRMQRTQKPKLVVIVGPTSSGKTALSIKIARKFGGEVVSADSRQVYRGLDIGTGKVTKKEMAGIPHHLLDVANPKRQFSVTLYKERAERAIRDIHARSRVPILCGGTGFYIDAVAEGIILPDVPPDSALRSRLTKKSAPKLLAILQKIDPARAKTIEQKNPRRLIRAIEIARALGSVPPVKKGSSSLYDILWIGIRIPEEVLRKNIRARLLARIKQGMVAEARHLHERGLSWKRMEELGLEYRFLARFLKGEITKEEMQEKIEIGNRHYAKHKDTWFKRNKKIIWLDPKKEYARTQKLVRVFLQE